MTDLKGRFKTPIYPTPHSGIVALMVLEHQAGTLNRLSRAILETRMALYYQREMNKALGQPADEPSERARSRFRGVGDAVVEYLLFGGEGRLTHRTMGTSPFAADFATRGSRDSKRRSLRDFDLKTRLFRYGHMRHRRCVAGLLRAEERFRRVKGHRAVRAVLKALSTTPLTSRKLPLGSDSKRSHADRSGPGASAMLVGPMVA